MKPVKLKLIGVIAAVAVLSAACGGTKEAESGKSTTSTSVEATEASGTDSGASKLRGDLTALLSEHVYLAGITTGEALAGRDHKPAAAALEKNTQGLQDAVTSIYGEAGGKQFGDLWRKHIGFFVDYTTGRATKDEAKVQKAKEDLDGYREDFGAFLESATKGGLPKQAVADELKPHVESLTAAIDAQAAKEPVQFENLRVAASHMPMTASVLAGAFAKQFPDKFGG